jgi:hypothetical protein
MTAEEAFHVELAWRDLVIAGKRSQIDQLLTEIERLLPPEWERNTAAEVQAEKRAAERHFPLSPGRCYRRRLANREVWLWLVRASDYRVHGGLVEVTPPAQNSEEEAESILAFRQRVFESAARRCSLTVSRSSVGPRSRVTAEVMNRLWAFFDKSGFQWPPKGEALRHWREFAISAYQNHAAFDLDELQGWLVEKGWEATTAQDLIRQLLSDAALLSEYDDIRQPA